MKKKLTLVVSLLLVMALSIGGTLAYLTDKTDAIENTFTIGKVDITLAETGAEKNAKEYTGIVPGAILGKDPTITVTADSENCYVFVRITEENNTITVDDAAQDIVEWAILSGWTEAYAATDGSEYVYWKEVNKSDSDTPLQILAGGTDANEDGQVTINDKLTAENAPAVAPTLTFMAAAIQADNITKAEVWAALPSAFTADITSINFN